MDFFTEIAHEIRTPLSLIDLPLEAIEEIGVDNPDIERYVKVTRQNTKRLLELTGQLLDFEKIDAKRLTLKNENVNINEFVRNLVSSRPSHSQASTWNATSTHIRWWCRWTARRSPK